MKIPSTSKKSNPETRIVPSEPVVIGPGEHPVEGEVVKEYRFNTYDFGKLHIRANTYKELIKGALQAEEHEEQKVAVEFQFDCYPLDGIVAINRALEKVYGFTHAKERQTFFGPQPPRRLSIATGINTSVEVAYGEMAPPAWEKGSLSMHVDTSAPLTLTISGVVKRKFERAIKEVVNVAKEYLKTNSIYRGKAVELDLSYIEKGEFDPQNCAPRFIDLSEKKILILPLKAEKKIKRDVWNRMRRPENFRRAKASVRRGVLFKGPFGTGKSLAAYITAQLAMETNCTYFYLKTPAQFLFGYKLAQMHASRSGNGGDTTIGPAVFFVEDCDEIFRGERSPAMNAILEALDGVGAKNCDVITVFTSNSPERINDAFKRSGRIDTEVLFTKPDAEAAGRFVQQMAGEFLAPDVDIVAVGEAFKDLCPADIENGVNLAKSEAMGDEDGIDIRGKVTTEMLVLAGEDMQEKVAPDGDGKTQHERDIETLRQATGILNPAREETDEKIKALSKDVALIKKAVRA